MPEILVIPRAKLFENDYFQGFKKEGNFEEIILKNSVYMERSKAENNPDYKQPIAYSVIYNPFTKQFFSFQRAKKDKDYGEKRLQGKWSLGIGGHIEKYDSENPIINSMMRELEEEVEMQSFKEHLFGYINNDSDDIGKVHFGIVYVIETNADVRQKAAEIMNGNFRTLAKLITKRKNMEKWSQIIIPHLRGLKR